MGIRKGVFKWFKWDGRRGRRTGKRHLWIGEKEDGFMIINWFIGVKVLCIIFKHYTSLYLHLLFITLINMPISSQNRFWFWNLVVRKRQGSKRTVMCSSWRKQQGLHSDKFPKWFVLRRFVHPVFRNTEKLWMENQFPLLSVSLHSGTGWLPQSGNFGLQSRLDLRAVGPDIPVPPIWDFVSTVVWL